MRKHFPWIIMFAGIGVVLLITSGCHYYNLEKKLDPENAEWLNELRYIMTSKERKLFLDLPPEEREDFKREFWAKRDPDPGTEENEFKMEFDYRFEQANDLFITEGKPGWLTDRGRIFILFGPPLDRLTYPQSYSGRCQEVWYYGNFPVVFIDQSCSGHYILVTYNLTNMRQYNLMYMHELSQAQAHAQQTIRGESGFFNFDWDISAKLIAGDRAEGIIKLEVPYANLWFSEQDESMVTTLALRIEILDAEDELLWENESSYEIKTNETELEEKTKRKFSIEVPFVLTKQLDRLRIGKNKIFAILTNKTGDHTLRKVRTFSLPKK